MVRRNRGASAKVEAKKDVVKSKAISRKLGISVAICFIALLTIGAKEVQSKVANEASKAELAAAYKNAVAAKEEAHIWAHKRGAGHRYHRRLSPITSSLKAEQARADNWKAIAKAERMSYMKYVKEKRAEARRLAAANRDLHLALKLASKHYGVSYSWLHACAHSEGHIDGRRPGYKEKDPFIMNHQGSGAGGWMQWMESSFNAYPQARTMLPYQYRQWKDRLGQAYTAAYVFKQEGSRQWTGSGC